MIIKDEALKPYWIESDYNGLFLYEPNGKGRKELMRAGLHELHTLLGDVIKRKMAALEGTVTLKEYTDSASAMEMMMKDALGIRDKERV